MREMPLVHDPSEAAPSCDRAGPFPGEVLCDRYCLVRRIAWGDHAIVLCALDELSGQVVVLKVLLPNARCPDEPELHKRVAAATRLVHPSIARVYDYQQHGPWKFLVMEYIKAPNLARHAATQPGGRLSPAQTIHVGLQCLDALGYAHAAGFPHGEVEASNILVSTSGATTLCDFGLTARPRDARSDLYALAATLYAAGNGPPAPGASQPPGLRARLHLPPPRSPHLPAPLDAVVRKAMQKDPEQRYQSAAEMRHALLCAADGVSPEPVAATPPVRSPREQRPARTPAFLDMRPAREEALEVEIEFQAPLRDRDGMVAIGGRTFESRWGGRFTVRPFRLDATPVTNAMFAVYVSEGGGTPPSHWRRDLPPAHELDHPVTWVSLDEARRYAAWRSARLPTQIEWEAAARGPRCTQFPWGDEWEPERCHGRHRGLGTTVPVGSLVAGASPEGCLDLVGNVWEWTEIDVNTPQPAADQVWVCGGSFRDLCNPNGGLARTLVASSKSYAHLGFRCARDAENG